MGLNSSAMDRTVLITTTQRCGSTWTTRVTRNSLGLKSTYINGLSFNVGPQRRNTQEDIARFLRHIPNNTVCKTHDFPDSCWETCLDTQQALKIVTVLRNFKDVLVSRYFHDVHHKKLEWKDPKAKNDLFISFYKQIPNELPDKEAINFLIHETDWAKASFKHWKSFNLNLSHPRFYRLSFEEMVNKPEETFRDYADFLKITRRKMERVRRNLSFSFMSNTESSRSKKEGAAKFYRKGLVGDGDNYISESSNRILQDIK